MSGVKMSGVKVSGVQIKYEITPDNAMQKEKYQQTLIIN